MKKITKEFDFKKFIKELKKRLRSHMSVEFEYGDYKPINKIINKIIKELK